MENSSPSQISQDSPIVFPSDGFRPLATIGFIVAAALVFFLLTLVLFAGWGVSQHLTTGEWMRAATGMPAVIVQGVAEIFAVVFIVALLPAVAKTSLAALGFRPLRTSDWAAIAIGAAAMYLLVTPVSSLFQTLLHFKTPEAAVALYTHAVGWQKFAFALFGILIAPLFEEAAFRWTLFNAMRRWWGFWPGAIVSSLLFGVAHAQAPWTATMLLCLSLPLAIGGLVLCYVYAKTNNAWASFATHGAFNAITFVLLSFFPQLAK